MHILVNLVRRARFRAVMTWHRLSATQRLMLRGGVVVAAVVLVGGVVGWTAPRAVAWDNDPAYTGTAILSQYLNLRRSLDTTSGELEIARLQLKRAEELLKYSARYQIPADLTTLIYDTALQEGIDPELAFRLVRVESGFNVKARSSAGALGLAQVLPSTARFYQADITTEQLFEPARNLRIGFRYLRDLLGVYGDVKLALLAYNRGPGRLKELLDQGRDPRNGYASTIMRDYPGLREQ